MKMWLLVGMLLFILLIHIGMLKIQSGPLIDIPNKFREYMGPEPYAALFWITALLFAIFLLNMRGF